MENVRLCETEGEPHGVNTGIGILQYILRSLQFTRKGKKCNEGVVLAFSSPTLSPWKVMLCEKAGVGPRLTFWIVRHIQI
jgi:hypothetical protein